MAKTIDAMLHRPYGPAPMTTFTKITTKTGKPSRVSGVVRA